MPDDHTIIRVPTYIPSVDKILGGGVPIGSTILLFSEPGAGGPEFLFTSLVNYCREVTGDIPPINNTNRPDAIYYITPKTSRVQFVDMMKHQFSFLNSIDFEGELLDKCVFHKDMGDVYFARSIVPLSWYSQKTLSEHLMDLPPYDDYGGLAYLAGMVETAPENSMVYIDSLTPYLPYFSDQDKWQNLVFLIYGLSRAAKKRNITFIILLTNGILPESREIALGNAFDAIIRLVWQKSQESMSRQRQMYIEKFAGVLPLLSSRDIATYNVSIAPETGFEISNLRRVA